MGLYFGYVQFQAKFEQDHAKFETPAHMENIAKRFVQLDAPADYASNDRLETQVETCLTTTSRTWDKVEKEGMLLLTGPKMIGKTSTLKRKLAERKWKVFWMSAQHWVADVKKLAPRKDDDSNKEFVAFNIALTELIGTQPDPDRVIVIDDAQKLLRGKSEKAEFFDMLNSLSPYVRVILIVSDRAAVAEFQKQSHWGARLDIHYLRPGKLAFEDTRTQFMKGTCEEVQRAAYELFAGSFGLYGKLRVARMQSMEKFNEAVSKVQGALESELRKVDSKDVREMLERVARAGPNGDGDRVSADLWQTSVVELVKSDILTPTESFEVTVQDGVALKAIQEFLRKRVWKLWWVAEWRR